MMGENISLEAWRGNLQSSKQGYKKSLTNLMMFLQNVKSLGNTLRWNELAERVEWNGRGIDDSDLITIRLILEANQYEAAKDDVLLAVTRHAKDNAFHPVRDYLRSVKWDGTKRLDYWLQQCLGAADLPFVRAVGRRTLIAAVARAFRPGCKVDTVLVLEGLQGVRKSTAIARLFSDAWTAESVDLFDKHEKMVMKMMGAWCVELAEFIAIARKDQNAVKGMLSMRSDRVVLPYAKLASDHPRQCIFFGTINPGESGYLTDKTGNRRYWPVAVTKADLEKLDDRRDQLWAEAYKAFQTDEQWWLTDEEESLAVVETEGRETYDVWDEILHEKLIVAGIVTTSLAAALHAIGVPNERMDEKAKDRVSACLRRIGYKSEPRKERGADGKRHSIRVYVRAP